MPVFLIRLLSPFLDYMRYEICVFVFTIVYEIIMPKQKNSYLLRFPAVSGKTADYDVYIFLHIFDVLHISVCHNHYARQDFKKTAQVFEIQGESSYNSTA